MDKKASEGDQQEETIVHWGGAVKSLGDGKVGGYLVLFGDETNTDMVGDYFTPDTDFDIDAGDRATVYWEHGLDPLIGKSKLGRGHMKMDDTGVWIEAQLTRRDQYVIQVQKWIDEDRIGWSSGVPSHLVERTAKGQSQWVSLWPLGKDASLTLTPMEPRILAVSLKSYESEIAANLKALWPQDAVETASVEATESSDVDSDNGNVLAETQGETKMADNVVVQEKEAPAFSGTNVRPVDYDRIVKETSDRVLAALKALPAQNDALKTVNVVHNEQDMEARSIKQFGRLLRGELGSTRSMLKAEAKATTLQVDADEGGGYLVTPERFVNSLIKGVDDLVFIRRLARVERLTEASSLGMPYLDNDMGDPTWTAELGTGSLDDALKFGKRTLTPHPLARRAKISKTLVRRSADIEGLVRERLAYRTAIVMENAYLTGDGAGQPLGVFVASDDGIGTARDVSAAADTTLEADDFINCKYNQKLQYWGRLQWIINRSVVKLISKLKDGDGRYIWDDGLRQGTNIPTLCGFPVNVSEDAPSTVTSGLYVAILGDFSNYHIVEALDMSIEVLTELYAETNQNGYILRYEGDGMPVLAEAFTRLKMA